MSESIFVLDIGTRSVMALLASLEDKKIKVEKLIFREHETRAMLDGQIHHIDEVTHLVDELVQEMNQFSEHKLKKVAVAAAGRALKTSKGTAKNIFSVRSYLTEEDVLSLEIQAVQQAQLELPKSKEGCSLSQQYYCVGYSVIEQRLDNIMIGSLLGQKGQKAEVDVIATFLPRVVVDSLQTVIENLGMEMVSITLEPIAVANLVLTHAMRRLNLALVDIGAGTSDIAICGENTISAFGMVPMAGDEITEALSERYLLDFNRAEEVKRHISIDDKIKTFNALGIEETYSSKKIKKDIKPSVELLAGSIAKEIIKLNIKPPQAILLVGGGSMTPGLGKSLASMLGISMNRVAIQQADKIQCVKNLPEDLSGPNFITVLAIAYTALTCPTLGFITVNVNGQPIKMLNMVQNNVAGALLAGGYNLKEMYGRLGMALTYEINGEIFTAPGEEGEKGELFLNNKSAEFCDKVKEGDCIKFIIGKNGKNASITFGELFQDKIGYCTVNGKRVELKPTIKVKNKSISLDKYVPDACKIEVENNHTISKILEQEGFKKEAGYITVNGKKANLIEKAIVNINGEKANIDKRVNIGDCIDYKSADEFYIKDFIQEEAMTYIKVEVNGKPVILNSLKVCLNNTKIDPRKPIALKNGDVVEFKSEGINHKPILIDVFNEINISTQLPQGKSRHTVLVNGVEKEYTYQLKHGDKIEIKWV
ncbi:MAG: pilus assembly protein PilM [Clostridia bacterium]|nr:pilus assembly protein PilM [Clostridia bacterium]MDD4048319.1 pilus assembly protein PilM [Clostridia bacterium]